MKYSNHKRTCVVCLVSLLVFLFITALSYFRVFDNYELQTLDIRFRMRGKIPINKDIVIIEIGDDTIDKLGKWPISRKYHATLIDALTYAGARAIIFDVFFSEDQDPGADASLEEAIKKSGKVYLPHIFNLIKSRGHEVPAADKLQEKELERFAKYAKGVGFINVLPDTDGKFRRIPPLIKFQGVLYPHVCFLVFLDYLGMSPDAIKITAGKYLTLGKNIKVPLDSDSTCLVNFPGRWEDTFRHYSYIDIIDSYVALKFPTSTHKKPVIDLSSLKGSTCFIGVTATATPDAHPSPFDSLYPGVGVNASLFNSLLTRKFVQRANRFVNLFILITICFLTAFISKRAKTLFSFIIALIFILVYMLFAAALFIFFGLWIDVFYPVMAIALVYLGITFFKYISEVNKIEILEKELNIAKTIQESFLPKGKPDVPGIDVAASMSTAKQVGGDLYDFILNKKGKFGLMIGDVSGKGVPAALYMAKVVGEFKTCAHGERVSEIMQSLNKQLCLEGGSGLFVTLTYVLFDLTSKTLSYSTGGHLPMVFLKKNDPEPKLIDLAEGTPLGLFEGNFMERSLQYEKGDMFILYTDGVTEAMDPKGEMFEQDRFVDLVKRNSDAAPDEMVNLIQSAVKKFEGKQNQHDDITVIAARIV